MPPASMHDFLDYVLRQLIDFPEEMVLIKTGEDGKKPVFKVRLRQSDVGKVIGKHGHTIIAIRNLLAAGATRTGDRATLEIIEEGGGPV